MSIMISQVVWLLAPVSLGMAALIGITWGDEK